MASTDSMYYHSSIMSLFTFHKVSAKHKTMIQNQTKCSRKIVNTKIVTLRINDINITVSLAIFLTLKRKKKRHPL